MAFHSIVSEYAPPSRLRVKLSAVTMTYRFSMWFARLMEPLITPMAEKKLRADLAQLKGLAEAAR